MKTLVGYGPRTVESRRRPRKGTASPTSDAGAAAQLQLQGAFAPGGAESSAVVEGDETPVPSVTAPVSGSGPRGGVAVLAKPPVRKLARDLGVDLRDVTPTGPNGTITRADVEGFRGGAAAARLLPRLLRLRRSRRRPGPVSGRRASRSRACGR